MEDTIKEEYSLCRAHPDCLAYKDGFCHALNHTGFGHEMEGSGCRFYKAEWEHKKERKAVIDVLITKDRTDLLEKYMPGFEDWEMDYMEERLSLGDLEKLIDEMVAAEKTKQEKSDAIQEQPEEFSIEKILLSEE